MKEDMIMSNGNEGTVRNETIPILSSFGGPTNLPGDFFESEQPVEIAEVPEEETNSPSDEPNVEVSDEQGEDVAEVESPVKEQTEAEAAQAEAWKNRFKSADEIYAELLKKEKSYDNLLPKFTKTAQELSSLRKAPSQQEPGSQTQTQPNMGIPQQPFNQAQANPQAAQTLALLKQLIRSETSHLIEPMLEKQSEISMATEVMRLGQSDPENFDNVLPYMKEEVKSKKYLLELEGGLEMAYNLGKMKYIEKNAEILAKKQREDATALSRQKATAPGAGAGTGAIAEQAGKSTDDVLVDSILNVAREKRNGSIF